MFQTNLRSQEEGRKKTSGVLPNVRFEAYPSKKNCGIQGIYEKPSLQHKKKHSLNWIGKRLQKHPLPAQKISRFSPSRDFFLSKKTIGNDRLSVPMARFFFRFCFILSPNLRHWCIHTSLLCISFQQLLIDRTATSRHHLTSIFVFRFSSDIAHQSVPPL